MAKKEYSKIFNQRNEQPFNYSIEGKLPPQAVDLEASVLGGIMLYNLIDEAITILKPETFYKDAHARIYSAILRLSGQSFPIDIMTVTQELKKSGELDVVGGAYFISQLTNNATFNVEYNCRILAQYEIKRALIKTSMENINACYDNSTDCFDVLEKASESFFKISEVTKKTDFESTAQLVGKTLKEIEANGNRKDGIVGVPSGLSSVDRITGGWQKQNLIIIAGRPAMGKSAFVLSAASNAAFNFNKKVAVFSLEMSKFELMKRLISSESEINNQKLKKGDLQAWEWEKINNGADKFYKENLFIDDTPGISVFELRAKARRLKEKKGIELIIIDYLQLMVAGGDFRGSREEEVSKISRSLKALAKELDLPVIALSQLSRAVETRGGGAKPKLSDLRESGAIEQDADMVGFLYRPSYYGIVHDGEGNSFADSDAFLLIEKHRDGAIDDAKFKFIGEFTKFTNIDSEHSNLTQLQPNRNFYEVEKDEPF